MNAVRTAVSARLMVGAVALLLGVSGCRLLATSQRQPVQIFSLPRPRTCVLEVFLHDGSPAIAATLRSLVAATVRGGEHLFIRDSETGALLASGVAPGSPSVTVPGRPARLAPGATSFQKSRYQQAMARYWTARRAARAELGRDERARLMAWVGTTVRRALAQLSTTGAQTSGEGSDTLDAALRKADGDTSSLAQAGLGYGGREVIALLGVDEETAASVPGFRAVPTGATVVVNDFPGSSEDQATWQAHLLQAGAARAAVLTPATSGQLASVVRQGLDGAFTDTLTSVLFGLGQARLRPGAVPQLKRLLSLLQVSYPRAVASIDGYTDDLPVPGGNRSLSRRRAEAVLAWLVAHGVQPSRLQAAGYGSADPAAPNTPHGQPLNRRVVVVIDPAA
jgi:outer membrane protein OmpA-like peptidoglycan-associated protein